jgi:hypothetical protein
MLMVFSLDGFFIYVFFFLFVQPIHRESWSHWPLASNFPLSGKERYLMRKGNVDIKFCGRTLMVIKGSFRKLEEMLWRKFLNVHQSNYCQSASFDANATLSQLSFVWIGTLLTSLSLLMGL